MKATIYSSQLCKWVKLVKQHMLFKLVNIKSLTKVGGASAMETVDELARGQHQCLWNRFRSLRGWPHSCFNLLRGGGRKWVRSISWEFIRKWILIKITHTRCGNVNSSYALHNPWEQKVHWGSICLPTHSFFIHSFHSQICIWGITGYCAKLWA